MCLTQTAVPLGGHCFVAMRRLPPAEDLVGGCSRAASPDHIRAANLIAIW